MVTDTRSSCDTNGSEHRGNGNVLYLSHKKVCMQKMERQTRRGPRTMVKSFDTGDDEGAITLSTKIIKSNTIVIMLPDYIKKCQSINLRYVYFML